MITRYFLEVSSGSGFTVLMRDYYEDGTFILGSQRLITSGTSLEQVLQHAALLTLDGKLTIPLVSG